MSRMKEIIKSNAILRRLYYRVKMFQGSQGQSDETRIISDLAQSSVAPKTFIEFGFHPVQFNCAALARDTNWHGMLIDGNSNQVADARALISARIKIVEAFLTLDNLDFIRNAFAKTGILSVDVDGNDYWFLEKLIDIEPSVICVEYNASFGLEPITVPYDARFDCHQKHPSGWYHGASLSALAKLCATYGYGLAAVSEAGGNAFFTRSGNLDPSAAWKPNRLRQEYSGVAYEGQWQKISHMPYVRV